jgi:flagellar basal body-associated protein FliL
VLYLVRRRRSEGIRMGLLTWIAIIVIILAVIGLGAGVFFSGVMRGADIVWNSPAVQNVTQEVEEFVQNNTGEEAGR